MAAHPMGEFRRMANVPAPEPGARKPERRTGACSGYVRSHCPAQARRSRRARQHAVADHGRDEGEKLRRIADLVATATRTRRCCARDPQRGNAGKMINASSIAPRRPTHFGRPGTMTASARSATAIHKGARPLTPEIIASTSANIARMKLIDMPALYGGGDLNTTDFEP
jgi:hypothetical protein